MRKRSCGALGVIELFFLSMRAFDRMSVTSWDGNVFHSLVRCLYSCGAPNLFLLWGLV